MYFTVSVLKVRVLAGSHFLKDMVALFSGTIAQLNTRILTVS